MIKETNKNTSRVFTTTFQKRLRSAIESARISQSELARQSGISKGAVSEYLSGGYVPKMKTLYRMADILNVNVEWLAGTSDFINRNECFIMIGSVKDIKPGMCVYDMKYGCFSIINSVDSNNSSIILTGSKQNIMDTANDTNCNLKLYRYSAAFDETRLYIYAVENDVSSKSIKE